MHCNKKWTKLLTCANKSSSGNLMSSLPKREFQTMPPIIYKNITSQLSEESERRTTRELLESLELRLSIDPTKSKKVTSDLNADFSKFPKSETNISVTSLSANPLRPALFSWEEDQKMSSTKSKEISKTVCVLLKTWLLTHKWFPEVVPPKWNSLIDLTKKLRLLKDKNNYPTEP